ncbi:MAG: MotA/TolQ/ExbB proton channel family protein [Vicinamibacterales bacterium]
MQTFESLLYEVTKVFMAPVLVVLSLMFVYALVALGAFLADAVRPTSRPTTLARFRRAHPAATLEHIELHILRTLEPLRITSRTAPMLGLVATMIPMGPALVAVTTGNAKGIAQNLVVAFSAVIIALLAAAITFTVLTVRRRWLLTELEALKPGLAGGATHV